MPTTFVFDTLFPHSSLLSFLPSLPSAASPYAMPFLAYGDTQKFVKWQSKSLQIRSHLRVRTAPHERSSGLCGRVLPAARPPGLPVLRPGGLGRIAGPLPGYGPVPQRGSACHGRAAKLSAVPWRVSRRHPGNGSPPPTQIVALLDCCPFKA